MGFTETLKNRVRRRANFTCCWCTDRMQRVEVHHIIPEAQGGPDDEDNAAPLCSNCHTTYGGNPDHRAEIRRRRDHWYEICAKRLIPEYSWPIGFDVPRFEYHQRRDPDDIFPYGGIVLTDRKPNNKPDDNEISLAPTLYLAVHFKTNRYFWPQDLSEDDPSQNEKWLYLEANMRPAFNLRIQVQVFPEDVEETMEFLAIDGEGWELLGPMPVIAARLTTPQDILDLHTRDRLRFWREDGERRMLISTYTAPYAGISIHARLSDEAAEALANYLGGTDFTSEL